MKFAKPVRTALAALIMSIPVLDAQAVLNAVDPGPYVAAYGFFPKWYQDTEGRALELCLSSAVIAADPVRGLAGGAACTLLANPGIFDPAQPMVFPTNFPDESFWFMGDTTVAGAGVDLNYVSNLEAAFGGGVPAVGDQIAFARIRIVPRNLPFAGRWTITHPYGTEIIDVAAPGRQPQLTRDIGIGAPGVFSVALTGDIGPFLVDASVPVSGPIAGVDPLTGVPNGELYIGDPNTPRPVLGSALVDAQGNRQNYVRVQGPNGVDVVQDQFLVMGKIWPGALPTPLVIERATYSRTATTAQQDVFAKAPATSVPVEYLDGNAVTTPMTDGDANSAWYGQSPNDPTLPTSVTVSATNAANNNLLSSQTAPLVDVVTITSAVYSAATGTLTVEAVSSDEAAPPALTANGAPMTGGVVKSVSISGLAIPPAYVTVTSANGGVDKEEVVVLP